MKKAFRKIIPQEALFESMVFCSLLENLDF
jgi:hypothetical protein